MRLARAWREGVLPEAGGVNDQAAITVASIEVILLAWSRLEAEERRKLKKG